MSDGIRTRRTVDSQGKPGHDGTEMIRHVPNARSPADARSTPQFDEAIAAAHRDVTTVRKLAGIGPSVGIAIRQARLLEILKDIEFAARF